MFLLSKARRVTMTRPAYSNYQYKMHHRLSGRMDGGVCYHEPRWMHDANHATGPVCALSSCTCTFPRARCSGNKSAVPGCLVGLSKRSNISEEFQAHTLDLFPSISHVSESLSFCGDDLPNTPIANPRRQPSPVVPLHVCCVTFKVILVLEELNYHASIW
jgi:hypothetical protein